MDGHNITYARAKLPSIASCPIHYECRIVFKINVKTGPLKRELEDSVYPSGNYHILYYGRILGVYVEKKSSI